MLAATSANGRIGSHAILFHVLFRIAVLLHHGIRIVLAIVLAIVGFHAFFRSSTLAGRLVLMESPDMAAPVLLFHCCLHDSTATTTTSTQHDKV